jgi:hypothetical protein
VTRDQRVEDPRTKLPLCGEPFVSTQDGCNLLYHRSDPHMQAPRASERSSSLPRFFRLVTIAAALVMIGDIEIMTVAATDTTIATGASVRRRHPRLVIGEAAFPDVVVRDFPVCRVSSFTLDLVGWFLPPTYVKAT